jgi:hypothetical protein
VSLAKRIQWLREKRLLALRIVRACEYLEARIWRRWDTEQRSKKIAEFKADPTAGLKRRFLKLSALTAASVVLAMAACGAPPQPVYLTPTPATLTQALRAITHPRPKTNGVVTLAWDAGNPPQTVISNLTLAAAVDVGTNQIATLGNQLVGTNVYVARNAIGASNLVTNNVTADTNRLSFTPYIYRAAWPGPAGVLQSSSNAVLFSDLRPIQTGEAVLITNNFPAQFFRVRITTNQP